MDPGLAQHVAQVREASSHRGAAEEEADALVRA